MNPTDYEIECVFEVHRILKTLKSSARNRVIEYVTGRLNEEGANVENRVGMAKSVCV